MERRAPSGVDFSSLANRKKAPGTEMKYCNILYSCKVINKMSFPKRINSGIISREERQLEHLQMQFNRV